MAGRRDKGFTLYELMLAITLIGILATLAVPGYTRMVERARVKEAQAILQTIFQAERIYRLDQVNDTGQNTFGTGAQLSGARYMDDPNLTNNNWSFAVPDPRHLDSAHQVVSTTVFSAVAVRTGGGWNNTTIGLDERFTGLPNGNYAGARTYDGNHPLRD